MPLENNREEQSVAAFNLEPIAPGNDDQAKTASEEYSFREIEILPEDFMDIIESAPNENKAPALRRRAAVEAIVYEIPEEILHEAEREEVVCEAPRKSGGEWVRVSGALLLICAVVAMIVAFVHAMTEEVIADAALREKQEAIVRIFGEGMEAEPIDPLQGTEAVYVIVGGGYCVNLMSDGFGGDLELMVGVKTDGTVCGVEIVALAETPGLGSKVQEARYLEQYQGQRGVLTLENEIDAISGATISSRAVLDGVNAALSALRDSGLIGGEGK